MQGLKRHDLKGEKRKGLGRGFRGESGTGRRSWDIIMTGSQVVTLGGGAMMVLYVQSFFTKGINVPSQFNSP